MLAINLRRVITYPMTFKSYMNKGTERPITLRNPTT